MLALYLPQESGLVPTVNKLANFFNPWSDEWSEVVLEPGLRVDPSAVEALRERLSDSEESLRLQAARALGILRARDTAPALVGALRQDTSNAVKFEAIRALRKIGDPSVGSELINYLRYGEAKVRNEAVYALGRLRYREAGPELMRLFEQESAKPRKERDSDYAARLLDAIAFIADPASRDLLAKEKQNPDALLRLRACEGVARLADPSLTTEISRDYLREKDAKVRTAQAFALYRMGRKEYLEVIGTALGSRNSSNEARQYLVEFRPEELPDLYTLAKRDSVGVREAVAEALGHIGDAQALPVLQELSKDSRGQVASNANQATRRINARLSAN
jgi:HEAT repeat protein